MSIMKWSLGFQHRSGEVEPEQTEGFRRSLSEIKGWPDSNIPKVLKFKLSNLLNYTVMFLYIVCTSQINYMF